MLVVAALCAQTTTFLVKRLHPDLMPLPLCSLGPLVELLLLRDLLRLVACGHIGFAVGGHLSGLEVCPLQSFLMGVAEFLAQVRMGGMRTPLSDSLLVPQIRICWTPSFAGVRAAIGVAWNVDVAVEAEDFGAADLIQLNVGYPHLDRFLDSLPRRFAGAFRLREPEPLDARLPLRVPAGAVGDLPVGERSFATQVVYFILWVTFGNVDYFLTFASVSDVRQNLGQPDGASSFSSHASFTGPFLVLESDSDPDD